MRRSGASVRQANQFCALEAPVRLAEQKAEQPLLHGREQRVGQAGWMALVCMLDSHFRNNHTHFG